jgi:hypothetical protein
MARILHGHFSLRLGYHVSQEALDPLQVIFTLNEGEISIKCCTL